MVPAGLACLANDVVVRTANGLEEGSPDSFLFWDGLFVGCCGVDRPCLVVAPPVLVLKIDATGRLDDVRAVLGVDGPGMASLQPASICWLINCSDTCREHIGLWLKGATENHKEPQNTGSRKQAYQVTTGLTSPVLELAIMIVPAHGKTGKKVKRYTGITVTVYSCSSKSP